MGQAGDFIRNTAKAAAEKAARIMSSSLPQAEKEIELAKINTGKNQITLPDGSIKDALITGRAPAVGLAFKVTNDKYIQINSDFTQPSADGGENLGFILLSDTSDTLYVRKFKDPDVDPDTMQSNWYEIEDIGRDIYFSDFGGYWTPSPPDLSNRPVGPVFSPSGKHIFIPLFFDPGLDNFNEFKCIVIKNFSLVTRQSDNKKIVQGERLDKTISFTIDMLNELESPSPATSPAVDLSSTTIKTTYVSSFDCTTNYEDESDAGILSLYNNDVQSIICGTLNVSRSEFGHPLSVSGFYYYWFSEDNSGEPILDIYMKYEILRENFKVFRIKNFHAHTVENTGLMPYVPDTPFDGSRYTMGNPNEVFNTNTVYAANRGPHISPSQEFKRSHSQLGNTIDGVPSGAAGSGIAFTYDRSGAHGFGAGYELYVNFKDTPTYPPGSIPTPPENLPEPICLVYYVDQTETKITMDWSKHRYLYFWVLKITSSWSLGDLLFRVNPDTSPIDFPINQSVNGVFSSWQLIEIDFGPGNGPVGVTSFTIVNTIDSGDPEHPTIGRIGFDPSLVLSIFTGGDITYGAFNPVTLKRQVNVGNGYLEMVDPTNIPTNFYGGFTYLGSVKENNTPLGINSQQDVSFYERTPALLFTVPISNFKRAIGIARFQNVLSPSFSNLDVSSKKIGEFTFEVVPSNQMDTANLDMYYIDQYRTESTDSVDLDLYGGETDADGSTAVVWQERAPTVSLHIAAGGAFNKAFYASPWNTLSADSLPIGFGAQSKHWTANKYATFDEITNTLDPAVMNPPWIVRPLNNSKWIGVTLDIESALMNRIKFDDKTERYSATQIKGSMVSFSTIYDWVFR